ncbi:hypothetical protein ANN_00199 [Periplaneta americana]|uniref:Uncharacterized protein n=1 Tax=Periplaneta americana TaxID=6978 RepID=A0ABQ8TR73_PERAM|nr:hypothetical protein ANN_00199 [Periplaneta americana]
MDVIKTESEIDSLAMQSETMNEGKRKQPQVVGKFLEEIVNDIKIEPPDVISDLVFNIKCEENKDFRTSSIVNNENEEESWNWDAVKKEFMSDMIEKNEDVTETPLQSYCHEDMKIHKSDLCDSSIDSFSITKDAESDNENCSLPDDTSSIHDLNVEFSNKSFNKLFPNQKQHKRKDSEVKSFTCSVCGKSFGKRYNLQAHEAIHRDDRPFKCDTCEKSFRKFHLLQRHESTHTSDKPFKCQICEKNFARLEYLRKHEAIHTDEKHFKCSSCDKRFRQRHHLLVHELTHKDEKPLKCDICGKGFGNPHFFRLHNLTHSDGKPFKCPLLNALSYAAKVAHYFCDVKDQNQQLSSLYRSLGYGTTSFDGEIIAISECLRNLLCHINKFRNADSKAAILSIVSKHTPSSQTAEITKMLSQLISLNKRIVFQWIPSHCGILGNENADALAKKGSTATYRPVTKSTYYSVKRFIKSTYLDFNKQNLITQSQGKKWNSLHQNPQLIPDLPRKSSVAAFRLATGHDCLAKHLHRIGIYQSPNCPLCNSNQEMDSEHLKICASVASHDNIFEKYWSARGQMTLLCPLSNALSYAAKVAHYFCDVKDQNQQLSSQPHHPSVEVNNHPTRIKAINMNGIKVEPSDLNYADLLELKREENEDSSFQDVKCEIEEDSWIVGAVEEESTSDVMEKDDDLTQFFIVNVMSMEYNKSGVVSTEHAGARVSYPRKTQCTMVLSIAASSYGDDDDDDDDDDILLRLMQSRHNDDRIQEGEDFSARNLKKHKHTNLNAKSFKCSVCGKIFGEQSNLKMHEQSHKGRKPYKFLMDIIKTECDVNSMSPKSKDTFKIETEIDPLILKNEEANEGQLSIEGKFLEINEKDIKMEPSDLNHDIKCEENEDVSSFPVLKFELEVSGGLPCDFVGLNCYTSPQVSLRSILDSITATAGLMKDTVGYDTAIYATHRNINIASNHLQEALNIICLASNHLQEALNIICPWIENWRIALNYNKCEAMIFTLCRPANPPCINLSTNVIPWKPKDEAVKYLGVHLDRRLSWKHHINNELKLAYSRLAKLYPLLNKKSSLKLQNCMLLYTSLLRPLLLYACPVWGGAAISEIKHIQSFQNKVLRISLNSPWFVRNNQLHRETESWDLNAMNEEPMSDVVEEDDCAGIAMQPHCEDIAKTEETDACEMYEDHCNTRQHTQADVELSDDNQDNSSILKNLKLEICAKDPTDPEVFEEHRHSELGMKSYKCNICEKSLTRRYNLQIHLSTHSNDKPHKCDSCDKSFRSLQHLREHKFTHTEERPYNCNTCEKSFAQYSSLRKHTLIHAAITPFSCNICNRSFAQHNNLLRHKSIHKSGMTFECKICKKSFGRRHHLQDHELTHTEQKPFKCSFCEKSFAIHGNLRRHESTHKSTGKCFSCDVCHKTFARIEYLRQHMSTHSVDKRFKCGICDRSFARIQHLRQHEATHSREKPYKCNSCTDSFRNLTQLRKHSVTHTGEDPLKCNICEKTFSRFYYLEAHSQTHTVMKGLEQDGITDTVVFQQDGTPPHFALIVREYLNEHFPNTWTGRDSPRFWSSRSPDLMPLDFFAWGFMNSKVYRLQVDTL